MIEITYASYLIISIAMTVWVARTLSKNGLIFLIDSFNGNERLAESVNHLLVVGFYLLNIGYILLALKTSKDINTLRVSIEFLSQQVGFVLLVLGLLHIFNVYVIAQWRYRSMNKKQSASDDKLVSE